MGSYWSSTSKIEAKITGHVAIVTGASRGLGFETSKQLYKLGAIVYLGCRTEEGANKAMERIRAEVPVSEGQLKWLPMDLSTIKQSRESAEEFLKCETSLDILVNNAFREFRDFELNEDGVDAQFAVNHIGHFVFTTTVLDLMKQTSAQPGSDVRIAVVSSVVHDFSYKTPISFSEPSDLSKTYPAQGGETWVNQMARYGRTKLANILFASELQRRLEAENSSIIVTSLHPGAVDTEGAHDVVSRFPVLGRFSSLVIKLFFVTLAEGAGNSVFAAASPLIRANPEKYKGKYLAPVGKVIAPSALAQNVELSKQLWTLTEQIVESRAKS